MIFKILISRLPGTKKQRYYCLSFLLGLIGIIVLGTGVLTLVRFIVSCTLLGMSRLLWILGANAPQQSIINSEEYNKVGERNIYTNSGNYNELIQGDYIQGNYIKIQDCYININQELSEVAAEFREVMTQLKNNGYSAEKAEVQVAKDLEAQARSNHRVKKRLNKWVKSLNNTSTKINEADAAREVIKYSASQYTSSTRSACVVSGKYYKLSSLLEARKWKEADEETENLIFNLLCKEKIERSSNHAFYLYSEYLSSYLSSQDVEVLPGKDLNIIDKLWVDHSGGRFGFSVQKCIWESIVANKLGSVNYYDPDFSKFYQEFGKRVGWYVKGDWIYYSDIKHSLTAPPGHLPIAVMLAKLSKKCDCDKSIFHVFMKRQYY